MAFMPENIAQSKINTDTPAASGGGAAIWHLCLKIQLRVKLTLIHLQPPAAGQQYGIYA